MPGYREEPGVDPRSRTETYAALRLDVDNWRWAGVPFYVRTGKRLPAPGHRGGAAVPAAAAPADHRRPARGLEPDALILRIQPDEGITLRFGAKVPGHHFRVRSASMDFSYEATFREESPEAYERLHARRADRRPDAVHPLRRGRAVLADRRPDHRPLGERQLAASRPTIPAASRSMRPLPGGRRKRTSCSRVTAASGTTADTQQLVQQAEPACRGTTERAR